MAEDTKKSTSSEVKPNTVTLTIDGCETTVPRGTSVLVAAQQMGIEIPTFCWHPKLKSVGACRMCYVEIEKRPKLEVSCATEALDGMLVMTNSDKVLKARRALIAFQLLNHPLDCPTCDKGGECTLQDLTVAHGFDDSQYEFQKDRFVDDGMTTTFDDLQIGPEIVLNRNRCILCYRCVRANKEAFGEYDLGVYERGNRAEIGAAPERQVDNPFFGNLIEICPVGALTSEEWRYKVRVWLTKTVQSICNFTSSGTGILFYKDSHKNHIYRVQSSCNDDIDDGWLANLTRYSHQVITSDERLQTPLIKKDGQQVTADWDEALTLIHRRFSEIKEKKGGVCIGGLAAPNLDNATLYSFGKFIRTVLNSNNLDFRQDYKMLPAAESVFGVLCRQEFKIADIDDSDVIVTFGSDLLREHPNEYIRMRKAYNFSGARLFSINPYAVKSADIAEKQLVYKAGTDETLINGLCLAAIEENLVDQTAATELLGRISPSNCAEAAVVCGVDADSLKIVARALAAGHRVTFVIGELIARSTGRESIASALANLDRLFGLRTKGQMGVLARHANSMGAELLGLMPQPSEAIRKELELIWGRFPDSDPHNTDAMLALMKKEEIDGFFVVGANPIMLCPDRAFVQEGISKVDFMVACDLFETETTALADVVLPLSSWAEYDGTYVNLEGRAQKARKVLKPIGQSKPGYEIVAAIAERFDAPLFESSDQLTDECDRMLKIEADRSLPVEFLEVRPQAPVKAEEYPHPLYVVDDAHHTGHLSEKAHSLANVVGEAYIELSRETAAKYKLASGDPVRVESEIGKVIVPVRISKWIKNDALVIPRNFFATKVNCLLKRKDRVNRVKISKVDE